MVLAVLGGLAVVGGLAAVLLWADPARIFTGSSGVIPPAWTVPLASVFVIAGVAWLLLSQDGRGRGGADDGSIECPVCGRSVMTDWRMCPYCGSLLEPDIAEPNVADR